ncbi:MAG: hypothetical protein A3K19_08780 [Lentisphaerae bacterium RIFOXYB12_FULL_65_16]|nr:MAG: hypothetical protein A3K18_02705 [Lentisphaerae bacterium RIFOXYA12_64_32]OGV86027.1 MAG: hypothetical protein A3K19_08780 [Lentisphaerae bacterium RIFOXYB12_FULL_65_16]
MDVVIEIIQTIFDVLSNIVRYFAGATAEAELRPDLPIVAAIVIILTFMVGSGCWAGAIAEARRHFMKRHFILGFFIPGVYPIFILFAMDVKGAKEREQAWKEKQEKEEQEAAARRLNEEGTATGQKAAAEKSEFDLAYFKRISLDKDGNPTGPWCITFGDTEATAQRIVEALPNAVVIQTQAEDGTNQTIRIPYAKITGCKAVA